MESSVLNPQANFTPSMPLFLRGDGAPNNPADTAIAAGMSPISRPPAMVNAALPGPMSGAAEQDAQSIGRGSVIWPPPSHTSIPVHAIPGVSQDTDIQLAPTDFLSRRRTSNVASSVMAANFSAPQTGTQAGDKQRSTSTLALVYSRRKSVSSANTDETQGQHTKNKHKYERPPKKLKTISQLNDHTVLSTLAALKGRTIAQIHMQNSGSEKTEMLQKEETTARKAKPRRKKHRAKVVRDDKHLGGEHLNLNTDNVLTNELSLSTCAVVSSEEAGGLLNSLVPFGGQMIIPCERPLHSVKKQHPRAKVNLDFETRRVWKLLMGKTTEPLDGTGVDEDRWWKQERKVFQGRANSFIEHMQLIQGNRRFSSWKGSVVDSVVGVFLTQNVSDHVSSSAYMALAATFPLVSVNNNCKDDITSQDNEEIISTSAVGGLSMFDFFDNSPRPDLGEHFEGLHVETKNNDTTGKNLSLSKPSDNHTSQKNCTTTVISTQNSPKTCTDLPVDLQCNKSSRFEASDLKEKESLSAIGEMIAETVNGVNGFTSKSALDKAAQASKPKKTRTTNKKNAENVDWDKFRRQACDKGYMKERIFERRDSADWEAVRCADVHRISHVIQERGMNNILAERIQSFLNRLVKDHGCIDLEWLREISPDSAKYELHYHMITFGKVFCTKKKPNCNACPMRNECRHFGSAFASSRLALPAPEEKSLVYLSNQFNFQNGGMPTLNSSMVPQLEGSTHGRDFLANNSEPIIEEPESPREEERPETLQNDIEDYDGGTDEIPMVKLNLKNFITESKKDLRSDDIAKVLVSIGTEAASIPVPKLKNIRRLRTEHYVYELPDSHSVVKQLGLGQREPDDPSPYLLTVWLQDDIKGLSKAPKPCCDSQMEDGFFNNENCQYCVHERENQSRYIRGTILVPCRTAMKGSFPLNGTYFQVNEVFADHKSSHNPVNVLREELWTLERRMIYFGPSVPSIFKGLTTEEVQECFWRGFVCVRGFDMETRAPKPLCSHLHIAASKFPRSRKPAATEQQNLRSSNDTSVS